MDIAVLIVDDSPLVRRGVVSALRADPAIRVVGEAETAAQALRLARSLRPDIALVDLRLPGGGGIELIESFAHDAEGPAVLVLTAIEKLDTMHHAAAAGARGYLTKRVGAGELHDAIVTVFGGGTVFDYSAAADLAREFPEISPIGRGQSQPVLTPRERQVLALVVRGHTDGEIARRLSLSIRTVQNHLSAIRRKTGLRRRAGLASWATEYMAELEHW
jgi:DNA-binding NarL/FixJ family response regulator